MGTGSSCTILGWRPGLDIPQANGKNRALFIDLIYNSKNYEAGAIGQPLKDRSKVIAQGVMEKERKKGFEITRTDRFLLRTRYFTDSENRQQGVC
jgi:hypothetical protein